MADKLIAALSCLPNITYDFPASVLSLKSAYQADPSGKSSAGKSYVVFGKQGNTNAIELSTHHLHRQIWRQ
jgi:hypothetical protein